MAENHIERGGYIESIGRRKTAVARVRISKVTKGVTVNGKPIEQYFPTSELRTTALAPFQEGGEHYQELGATIVVKGGGVSSHCLLYTSDAADE